MNQYPKRLIEVDLPIKRISEHARREKSIRHGHISTLHIWWARRPLAACRAVICAALWPDPVDELCPQVFREAATAAMNGFAQRAMADKTIDEKASALSMGRWSALVKQPLVADNAQHWNVLRFALLDFIADFANWDNSTHATYLETSRALTQAAHEALGGLPGTRPLVVDPFAGGGAIPLEALRVGAEAFASDLNPVAVLLNKVVLEYIPKYGQRLADEVRKWGAWVKDQAENELAEFYPPDPDGATPIAYLWTRTIKCEGPNCGVEVPMLNQLWIKKKGFPTYGYKLTSNNKLIEVDIVCNPPAKEIHDGTAKQGTVTCPACGFTMNANRVREIGRESGMGKRLISVVLSIPDSYERKFRAPIKQDFDAFIQAQVTLKEIASKAKFPRNLETEIPHTELRRISVPLYGLNSFKDLFLERQILAFSIFELIVQRLKIELSNNVQDQSLLNAILTTLVLGISNTLHYNMNLSTYLSNGMVSAFIQGTSLAMRSDFAEANPIMNKLVGGLDFAFSQIDKLLANSFQSSELSGVAEHLTATNVSLPDNIASLLCTDPPYYDSIPYSHLSDVFYIWNRSCLGEIYPSMMNTPLVTKDSEIVEDRAHSKSPSIKGADFFEREMQRALAEGKRVIKDKDLAIVVFAHKSTKGWEAMLSSLIEAEWTVTSSWPVDTERPARMNAFQNASLLSSIHVVCRPRLTAIVGDWRDVLQELPGRIHSWLPRLAQEGVVGADAIFACLGPALEIFSRYARVEKASGEIITLGEYLEYVWGAVSREALNMVFAGADTTGFEEDARLTAMWLWTLSTDDNESDSSQVVASTGYTLEYDAARKISQGLGAHLEQLTHLVEIAGSNARLLPVAERTKYLFGKEGVTSGSKSRKPASGIQQISLLDQLPAEAAAEWRLEEQAVAQLGRTMLDRVHQAMLLFAAGHSDALKRFLVTDGIGQDEGFWRLAQALSALYPANTDEKRWVDGILARKKGLGF